MAILSTKENVMENDYFDFFGCGTTTPNLLSGRCESEE